MSTHPTPFPPPCVQSLETKFSELGTLMSISPKRMGEMAQARPMLLTSSTATLKVCAWFGKVSLTLEVF